MEKLIYIIRKNFFWNAEISYRTIPAYILDMIHIFDLICKGINILVIHPL